MKKHLICMALSASMVLSGATMIFAADATVDGDATKTAVIEPTMEFTGTPIALSLDEAIKRMQTEGLQAQAAQLRKDSDEVISKGYREDIQDIRDSMNSGMGTSNYIDRDAAKLKQTFALENKDKNYQASLNQISSGTVSVYYGVLLAQDMVKAAEDNLAIQQNLLAREQKRFSLGLASKIDLSKAENAVTTAKDALHDAQVSLKTAKMGFNISMDYPVMQAVTFTDTLKEVPAPTGTLESAIKSGLENRMEIKKAVLQEQIKMSYMDHLNLIMSKNSAQYLQQQVVLTQLKMDAKSKPKQIEQEIRTKYMDVEVKKSGLDAAKSTKALSDEAYRLAMISYEAGMNTITDVQEAQLKVFQANQGVSKAIMDYDLAVYAYEYCQNVGTSPVDLTM